MHTCMNYVQNKSRPSVVCSPITNTHFISSLPCTFFQLALDSSKLEWDEVGRGFSESDSWRRGVCVRALCCSGETQLVCCQAEGRTQAHNSSSLQAPPQSIPRRKVSATKNEECPSRTSVTLPLGLVIPHHWHMQTLRLGFQTQVLLIVLKWKINNNLQSRMDVVL